MSLAAPRTLFVVRSSARTIFERLCLDEALFREKARRFWLVLDDYALVREERAVVLGLSGKVHEHVHEDKAKRDNVRIVRRFTGGGTVVVDDNVFVTSIIGNASQISPFGSVKAYPRELMRWTEEAVYQPAFKHAAKVSGVRLQARENDYVVEKDYKVGGNAQGISGDRFCHHTSFLMSVDPVAMSYLTLPNKRPEYRADRAHLDFLRGLDEYVHSREVFGEAIIRAYASALKIDEIVFNPPDVPIRIEETRNTFLN